MTVNTALLAEHAYFYSVVHQQIQAVSVNGTDANGQFTYNNSTSRTYRCYITSASRMSYNSGGITESYPYTAYVLSIPISGFNAGIDAVDILEDDKLTVVVPASGIPIRRLGAIDRYYDHLGNLHNMEIHFQ